PRLLPPHLCLHSRLARSLRLQGRRGPPAALARGSGLHGQERGRNRVWGHGGDGYPRHGTHRQTRHHGPTVAHLLYHRAQRHRPRRPPPRAQDPRVLDPRDHPPSNPPRAVGLHQTVPRRARASGQGTHRGCGGAFARGVRCGQTLHAKIQAVAAEDRVYSRRGYVQVFCGWEGHRRNRPHLPLHRDRSAASIRQGGPRRHRGDRHRVPPGHVWRHCLHRGWETGRLARHYNVPGDHVYG
ncbi:hypothetical protein HDU93_004025, partial [Gonapodya sp. JEL0774]